MGLASDTTAVTRNRLPSGEGSYGDVVGSANKARGGPVSRREPRCDTDDRHQASFRREIEQLAPVATPARECASIERNLRSRPRAGERLNPDFAPSGFSRLVGHPAAVRRKPAARFFKWCARNLDGFPVAEQWQSPQIKVLQSLKTIQDVPAVRAPVLRLLIVTHRGEQECGGASTVHASLMHLEEFAVPTGGMHHATAVRRKDRHAIVPVVECQAARDCTLDVDHPDITIAVNLTLDQYGSPVGRQPLHHHLRVVRTSQRADRLADPVKPDKLCGLR